MHMIAKPYLRQYLDQYQTTKYNSAALILGK